MPLFIVRQDITKMAVDVIVNATDAQLSGNGGVDAQIHRAAGQALDKACAAIGALEIGRSVLTKAYGLPCRYIAHTVGPVWRGGAYGERTLLSLCYESALELAAQKRCASIAFPLISTGTFGYPRAEALQTATDVIRAFLQTHDMTVYIVLFDREAFEVGSTRFGAVRQYITDRYAEQSMISSSRMVQRDMCDDVPVRCGAPSPTAVPFATETSKAPTSLDNWLKTMRDESFSQMLLRKIDEKGMTDAACYKKANVDRKLFSKIRGNVHYKPSKPTVIAFAVALELSIDETREMLSKAGLALSHSETFDMIVEYFIAHGIYDVYEINEALFAFDQCLLGA